MAEEILNTPPPPTSPGEFTNHLKKNYDLNEVFKKITTAIRKRKLAFCRYLKRMKRERLGKNYCVIQRDQKDTSSPKSLLDRSDGGRRWQHKLIQEKSC